MPDCSAAFAPDVHPRLRPIGEPVIYATIRLWNELDFQYHDHSGVVRRTADQVRALHAPPLVIVDSVRPL
jgi:hypothetical protein